MNGTAKIFAFLLSLTFSTGTFTDYYQRPTTRPMREHMREPTRNRYAELNETYHLPVQTERSRKEQSMFSMINADDNPIIYPEVPSCSYGLCQNVQGYPKEEIIELLNRAPFVSTYFNISEDFISIDNRFNTDEMSLCETKVHTIYPEKANNTMKVEKVIVNVDGYKQGIVFETCVQNGKCKFSSNFPTGYTSYCKQKYIHKKLMVLGDNNKFVFDSFEVPSCCVCTVTKNN